MENMGILYSWEFNAEICEDEMQLFCTSYNLKNLVDKPTCFKNIDTPTCIDLILTNKSPSFQNTSVIETGLSDFNSLTVTTLKCYFQKQEPKVVIYRNYKYFDNERFRNDLFNAVGNIGLRNIIYNDFETLLLNIFKYTCPFEKDIFVQIMPHSSIKNFVKQLWSDLDYEINFLN